MRVIRLVRNPRTTCFTTDRRFDSRTDPPFEWLRRGAYDINGVRGRELDGFLGREHLHATPFILLRRVSL